MLSQLFEKWCSARHMKEKDYLARQHPFGKRGPHTAPNARFSCQIGVETTKESRLGDNGRCRCRTSRHRN
jgi:hypothetical protein